MSRVQISDEIVDQIRELYAQGFSQGMLAKKFRGVVSLTYIGRIVRNEVRADENTQRTADEILMMRRNPEYEANQARDAAASGQRMWELQQQVDAAKQASAGEAPAPVAVQHKERCAMTLFPGSRVCTCGAIVYGLKKIPLEKPQP